jgi:hypothetical protein
MFGVKVSVLSCFLPKPGVVGPVEVYPEELEIVGAMYASESVEEGRRALRATRRELE